MINSKKILFVALILLTAGCVGQTTGVAPEINKDVADIIVSNNLALLPPNPSADSSFTARFLIKNQHDTQVVDNVRAVIFDTGRCTLDKIQGDPASDRISTEGGQTVYNGIKVGNSFSTSFAPGQEELVDMTLTAPSSQEIGSLSITCPIRYRITYEMNALTDTTIQAVSSARLRQLQTQSAYEPYQSTVTIGPGPIKVSVTPKTALPVEEGKTLQLEIVVSNEGQGEYTKIGAGTIKLQMPAEFEPAYPSAQFSGKPCGSFFSEGTTQGSVTTYLNADDIDLFNGKSSTISCYFKAPSNIFEKIYTVTAKIDSYEYAYFGEDISAKITP